MPIARLAVLFAGMLLATPAAAADALSVSDAYIRAPQPGSHVAAAYLQIDNKSAAADKLLAVRTAAGEASVHEMKMEGSVMRMRTLASGLDVPAGGSVALQPGGFHIMLEKLAKPLTPGDRVPMILSFAKAGDVPVTFDVRALGAPR